MVFKRVNRNPRNSGVTHQRLVRASRLRKPPSETATELRLITLFAKRMSPRIAIISALVVLVGCAHPVQRSLVGQYSSRTILIMPCDYSLALKEDGTFQLSGVRNTAGADLEDPKTGFEDEGRWYSDGKVVILHSKYTKKVRRLTVSSSDGRTSLSDGEPFGCSVEKAAANKPPEAMAVERPPSNPSPAPAMPHL